MEIKLLKDIRLNEHGTLVNMYNEAIHLRQDDMDGACGPYCVVMALLVLGHIRHDELSPKKIDFRTRVGRLLREIWTLGPMVVNGTPTKKMQNLVKAHNCAISNTTTGTGSNLFPLIIEALNESKPVILDISGAGLEHWTLAIGYSETHIYLLDPGYDLATTSYWNAAIQLNAHAAGIYNYRYANSSCCQKVRVSSIIVLA